MDRLIDQKTLDVSAEICSASTAMASAVGAGGIFDYPVLTPEWPQPSHDGLVDTSERESTMVSPTAEAPGELSYLLRLEPDQDDKNSRLVDAATDGDFDAVRNLLKEGAQADTYEDEPLRIAAANGYTKIVQLLFAYGANLHALNDAALLIASRFDRLETVRFLLSQDPSAEAKTEALQIAEKLNKANVIQMLRDSVSSANNAEMTLTLP